MTEDTDRHAMKMAKKKAARDKIMATTQFFLKLTTIES